MDVSVSFSVEEGIAAACKTTNRVDARFAHPRDQVRVNVCTCVNVCNMCVCVNVWKCM